MTDPIAQGSPEAVSQAETPAVGGSEVVAKPNGVEQRINELTAQMRESQRQAEALTQQNMELTRLYAQSMAQGVPQPQQAAPQLPDGVDPSIARYFEEQAKRSMAPLLAQLEAQVRQTQAQTAQLQMQTALAGEDPRVAQRANELMNIWNRNGATGWVPKDAIVYARGELGVAAPNPLAARQRNALGQFNAGGMDVLNGQPPPASIASPSEPPTPAYADQTHASYDPHQAAAFWAKKMNGRAF